MPKSLIAILGGLVVIAIGAYLYYLNFSKSEQPVTTPESSGQQAQDQNKEIVFADKLSSCTKYKIQFTHPLTGETLEKEILGMVAGKCGYVEQMPNGGKMECKYTESERRAAAQYYKDVAVAESVGTSVNVDLESGEQKTTYTIDGKEVENPLQEATDTGACIVSGY